MDLFTLAGKIAIDCTEAETKIDNLLTKVGNLNTALNGTGGGTGGGTGSGSGSKGGGTTTTGGGTTAQDGTNGAGGLTLIGGQGSWLSKAATAFGLFAIKEIGSQAKKVLTTGIGANAMYETQIAGFQTKMGVSREEAEDFFYKLRDFAKDTPLSIESVSKGADQLLAAGFKPDEIIDRLTVIGNNINGEDEKMYRATKAVTDVKGYDQLNAQEIRQNTENGIYIRELLKGALFGKEPTAESFAQGLQYIDDNIHPGFRQAYYWRTDFQDAIPEAINDLIENHSIDFNDYWNALVWAQEEGSFKGAMANRMNTFEGKRERLQDAQTQSYAATTKGLMTPIKWFMDKATEMFERNLENADPTDPNNPYNSKVLEIVDAITAPTPTLQEYLNEQDFKDYPAGLYGPQLPPGWVPPDLSGDGAEGLTSSISQAVTNAINSSVPAAVESGMGNVTITAGNVTLNDGTIVGRFLPLINLGLGRAGTAAERGNA